MKKSVVVTFLSTMIAMCSLAASALVFSMAWFKGMGDRTKEDENINGEIGLRSYFYAGTGTAEDPYEIVHPIHLYNLSRLQNYGVFNEGKAHFQIGHAFDGEHPEVLKCLDSNDNQVDYLDMGPFFVSNPTLSIRPIGSESTPFHGTFDGSGIPVKNLKIEGYPEDIGVFGYVAHDGYIRGLVCDTLQVTSLGYTTYAEDPDLYSLFSASINDIFNNSASYMVKETNLDFYNFKNGAYERARADMANPGLKNINGSGGVHYENIVSNRVASDSNLYKGYFVPTFPNKASHPSDNFVYKWTSSSPIIVESDALGLDLDSDGVADKLIMIDMSELKKNGPNQFNTGLDMQLDVRLSLTASFTTPEGITYSRVIESYLIEFHSNTTQWTNESDGGFSMNIYCNYVTPSEPSHPSTNYLHGNNIGFLVGHLDGTLKSSYVYQGTLKFNNVAYNPIAAETQTGLVGEVGTNVVNALDPDYKSTLHGETGVMNFTRIYDGIRGDYAVNDRTAIGQQFDTKYMFYDNKINRNGVDTLFDNYKDYLRKTIADPNSGYFVGYTGNASWGNNNNYQITSVHEDFNTVDFIFNNVIEDERDNEGNITTNRGMGVFKLVTPYNSSAVGDSYENHVFDNLGDCRIIKGREYQDVFFSTAEYNHTVTNIAEWGTSSSQIDPLRATTLPENASVLSFNYPFSRDYNYVFKLDLRQNVDGSVNNFMYDTDSTFLTNYLKSILIDKYGRTINKFDYRFGFMFKNTEIDELGKEYTVPVRSLSSYMKLTYPADDTTKSYNGTYYPSNSICFNVDNDNGANVSVVANGKNVSIYKFNTRASGTPTKLYTMKCENTEGIFVDSHRYFTYDYSDGEGTTSRITYPYSENLMGDDGVLYAHIFKLDKLPEGWAYCIGSSATGSNNRANLYYLAVQGQTEGNMGTQTAQVGNSLEDVDFLTAAPVKSDYSVDDKGTEDITDDKITFTAAKQAQINFTSNFNETNDGQITVNAEVDDQSGVSYANFSYTNEPKFMTYLFVYDFKTTPGFYVNTSRYPTNNSPTYTVVRSQKRRKE